MYLSLNKIYEVCDILEKQKIISHCYEITLKLHNEKYNDTPLRSYRKVDAAKILMS